MSCHGIGGQECSVSAAVCSKKEQHESAWKTVVFYGETRHIKKQTAQESQSRNENTVLTLQEWDTGWEEQVDKQDQHDWLGEPKQARGANKRPRVRVSKHARLPG